MNFRKQKPVKFNTGNCTRKKKHLESILKSTLFKDYTMM